MVRHNSGVLNAFLAGLLLGILVVLLATKFIGAFSHKEDEVDKYMWSVVAVSPAYAVTGKFETTVPIDPTLKYIMLIGDAQVVPGE